MRLPSETSQIIVLEECGREKCCSERDKIRRVMCKKLTIMLGRSHSHKINNVR